jgi:hypothetical protein
LIEVNFMSDIAELERRVTALEAGAQTDIQAIKRDLRKLAAAQDYTLEQIEVLNRRVAVFELETKGRFDKVDGRFDKVDGRFDKVDGRFDKVEARLDRIEAEQAAFRRDMPGMIADTMREVLKEGRG